jgi:FKBP-type peptidyl-prolyl cis-trans isomerase
MKGVVGLLFVCLIACAHAASYSSTEQKGRRYLVQNAKNADVTVTASGLQYKVLNSGTGSIHPAKNDQVKVHYTGRLVDGTVFDSSVERGQPATFGVSQVIKGWTEALQLMVVGDKWEVAIPENLAYGARGAGGKIGPHAALVFEVELLGIVGKDEL